MDGSQDSVSIFYILYNTPHHLHIHTHNTHTIAGDAGLMTVSSLSTSPPSPEHPSVADTTLTGVAVPIEAVGSGTALR